MRLDKRSRKIRTKKKGKKGASPRFPPFLLYLLAGLVLLTGFYLLVYRGHARRLAGLREEKIREDMDKICTALAVFRQDHGRYPLPEEGLQGLLGGRLPPEGGDRHERAAAYLDRLPPDPWGGPYNYEPLASGDSFKLACWGADGKPGGDGDASDRVLEECKGVTTPSD
ncbi:MAG: type II secretion system protein GspG [bacterium]